MLVSKISRALLIDVYRITVIGIATAVAVVIVSKAVVGIVISVAVVISPVVITSVPGRVTVVASAPIDHGGTMPTTVPTAVPPTTTTPAHQRSHGDSRAKSDDPRCRDVCRTIPWGHVRRSINNGRVIFRHIYDLWIGRLNHDRLWALLHNGDLGRAFQVAGRLRLGAKRLNCRHYLALLIVISLA